MWIFQFPSSSFVTKAEHIIGINTPLLHGVYRYFSKVSTDLYEKVEEIFKDGEKFKEMSEYDFNQF